VWCLFIDRWMPTSFHHYSCHSDETGESAQEALAEAAEKYPESLEVRLFGCVTSIDPIHPSTHPPIPHSPTTNNNRPPILINQSNKTPAKNRCCSTTVTS
jgi:hypothetical protein